MNTRRTSLIAALALALPLSLAACGSSQLDRGRGAEPLGAGSLPSDDAQPLRQHDLLGPHGRHERPFGAGCAAVPKDGKGSFKGMATDPVATAASNNPLLSTLVTAVKSAGLVDTLNSAQDITVFAPVNDAFAKIDPATLKKAMADPKGLLTKVLTNHVVPGKLTPGRRSRATTRPSAGTHHHGRGLGRGLHRRRQGQGHLRQRARPPTPPSTSSTACCCRPPDADRQIGVAHHGAHDTGPSG